MNSYSAHSIVDDHLIVVIQQFAQELVSLENAVSDQNDFFLLGGVVDNVLVKFFRMVIKIIFWRIVDAQTLRDCY